MIKEKKMTDKMLSPANIPMVNLLNNKSYPPQAGQLLKNLQG